MTDELSEVESEYKLSESRPESLSSSLSLRPGEIRGSGTCQRVNIAMSAATVQPLMMIELTSVLG